MLKRYIRERSNHPAPLSWYAVPMMKRDIKSGPLSRALYDERENDAGGWYEEVDDTGVCG